MKEKIYIFWDNNKPFYVESDASQELIQEALNYRNEVLENEDYPPSDLEIVQEYLKQKGYFLSPLEVEKEFNL